MDLNRSFNPGYGYAVFLHDQDSPTGRPAATKFNLPRRLEIDAKGRYIVVLKDRNATGNDESVLVRYLPNGSLDPAFGGGAGWVAPNGNLASLAGSFAANDKDESNLSAISWDSSYRYYTSFISGQDGTGISTTATVRLLENGTIDTDFASGGFFLSAPLGAGFAGGTVDYLGSRYDSLSDKMVSFGVSYAAGGAIEYTTARYSLDGTLDTSYGASSGYTVFQPGGGSAGGGTNVNRNDDTYGPQVIDDDHNTYVAITRITDTNGADGGTSLSVMKITAAGLFDSSFGPYGTGVAELPNQGIDGIAGEAFATKTDALGFGGHIERDTSGRLYASGTSRTVTGTEEAFVVRWTSAGMLDSSFGTGGIFRFNAGNDPVSGLGDTTNKSETIFRVAYDVRLDRIILSGTSGGAAESRAFIARLKMDGTLDVAFSDDGYKVLLPPDRPTESFGGAASGGVGEACIDLRIDHVGRYVLGCYSTTAAGAAELVVMRLLNTGEFND